jgi:hypothetical protein
MTRIDNNNITNAVQTNWKENTKNNLAKIEGILTSKIELKVKPRNDSFYFYAFFQLEGITQDIPVIFKLDSSSEPTPPAIPLRAKVLLEGH